MSSPNQSDQDLVIGLKRGSRQSFKLLFDRYQVKLTFYCLALVKSESVAKDIVQETFIRLWTHRESLDPDRSLSGFIHTIARNFSLNHLKRAGYDHELRGRIWEEIQDSQQRIRQEEDLFAEESNRLLQEAVDALSPRKRLIFKLSRMEGYTHEVIALRLNISKNTVKNHIVQASKDVRDYLIRHSDLVISVLCPFLLLG
ncbi:MAG: RNA polymerase sigma-70 factor [Balneolaceae bacterium]